MIIAAIQHRGIESLLPYRRQWGDRIASRRFIGVRVIMLVNRCFWMTHGINSVGERYLQWFLNAINLELRSRFTPIHLIWVYLLKVNVNYEGNM